MATSVFQNSGETALYNKMSAAQLNAWRAYHNQYPNRSYSHFLREKGPAVGLPSAAPAPSGADLHGGGGVATGGAPIAPTVSTPAFDPQQQSDYNSKFWDILYAGQGNESDYADAVLNDKMVQNAIDLNFKKARAQDADEESARGLTATGYGYQHYADIDADRQRSVADEALVFGRATEKYNANIARFNSNLAQLGEEGNISKFLNVANIAAGTAGSGALTPAAAPRSIAPVAPAAQAPAAQPHAPEGYGNPQYDPRAAAPQPVAPQAAGVPHAAPSTYTTSPEQRTKLNAVEYSRRLKEIRDRHGAGSTEVNNFRQRHTY